MSILHSLSRVRIHSHVTQSRFLHVEDALGIGKIRLFAGTYRRGAGLEQHGHHFLDIADARVVFGALARAEPDFSYREYKGTPTDRGAVSRVLSIQVKGDNVYVELKCGPGKLTPTGAVTPAGRATVEVNVGLKLYEARRLGAAILAYLRAWDVMQMLEYRDAIGQPLPYQVVPATSDGTENGRGAGVIALQPDEAATRQAAHSTRASGGPEAPLESGSDTQGGGQEQLSMKAGSVELARQTAEELFAPGNGHAPQPAPPLRYADGAPVDETNSAEIQTFRQFLAEKQTAPASRAALQSYYRRHAAVH
ncbi:MAG: hypothetical protein GX579_10650 [Chloroflexi bacterium]|nr:hypothetical protein [Chloroflexota bacterium]